jgi:hypothetical protein
MAQVHVERSRSAPAPGALILLILWGETIGKHVRDTGRILWPAVFLAHPDKRLAVEPSFGWPLPGFCGMLAGNLPRTAQGV